MAKIGYIQLQNIHAIGDDNNNYSSMSIQHKQLLFGQNPVLHCN